MRDLCPSRIRSFGATAVLAAALVACSTLPPAPAERPGSLPQATAEPPAAPVASVVATGPTADRFLSRPAAALDGALGKPALVRKEGTTEFRRYDLGDCRAYAVVARGIVTALSTGPAVVGAPALPFEQCTAVRVGS